MPMAATPPAIAPSRRVPRGAAVVAALGAAFLAASPAPAAPPVLVHLMPWYASKPVSGRWGWHWTMGRFDPDRPAAPGQLGSAAHDPPAIGLYDSRDPAAVECQVQLLVLSGIDGAVIDWYGTDDVHDYAAIHAATALAIKTLSRAGLRHAICYEDRAAAEVAKTRPADGDAAAVARRHVGWLANHWLADPGAVHVGGRPVVLLFGPRVLVAADDWQRVRAGLDPAPLLLALEHVWRPAGLDGVFGWPPVSGNRVIEPAEYGAALERLAGAARAGVPTVAVAFPAFRDVYAEAGLHESYGSIADRGGATLAETLDAALATPAAFVQIATFNDHGEGTAIEPSRDRGTARLGQVARRLLGPAAPSAADLELPLRLYRLRKAEPPLPAAASAALAAASAALFERRIPAAREALEAAEAAAAAGRGPPHGRGL